MICKFYEKFIYKYKKNKNTIEKDSVRGLFKEIKQLENE